MTQKFYLLSKSLLTKIALVAALMSWGGIAAEADDIIIADGSTISDGWNNGTSATNKYSIDDVNDCLISATSEASRLQSADNITLSDKRLVVKAKRQSDEEAYVILYGGYSAINGVKFGHNSKTANGSSYSELYSKDEYVELISDKFSCSNVKLDIRGRNVIICSIKIVDDKELLIDEDNLTALVTNTSSAKENVRVKYMPKSGWNTICMPFRLKQTVGSVFDHVKTIFGSDYKAYSLNSYDDNGTLTFKEETGALNYNIPYLIYIESAPDNTGGVSLANNVTICYANSHNTVKSTATFQGTYAPIAAGSMPVGSYGLTPSGQIRPAGSKSSLKGYRAYFTGVSAPSGGSDVRLFILDGDETTDVGLFKMVEGEEHRVFNLNGQEVQKAKKGLYIINGKKIVIK